MSRIGIQPVPVPDGVTIQVEGDTVVVKGPKGEMRRAFPLFISVEVKGGEALIRRSQEEKFARAMHGTARSLIANMVHGVKDGYLKELEIQGVGFRAQVAGQKLTMALGFSHPIEYTAPDGVTVAVADNTKISVSGVDKQQVGLASAQIRSYYPAEPYKGKGVRYKNEQIRRKAGKTVA